MGVGHVPAGPVPGAREGAHLPRREHRGAGEEGDLHLRDRRALGRIGEEIAAGFLARHGIEVLGRNLRLEGGEVDLVGLDRGRRVVVEVRTVTSDLDPIEAAPSGKRRRVARLAGRSGARADLVGVGIRRDGVRIHWVPGSP